MPITPNDMKNIQQEERLMWQSVYAALRGSYRGPGTDPIGYPEGVTDPLMHAALYCGLAADAALEAWRERFAPWRVGLGIQGEWIP